MCWKRPACRRARLQGKEGRPNVVDLIKGERIQLIINTPHGQETFFDEKAIRRAAVTRGSRPSRRLPRRRLRRHRRPATRRSPGVRAATAPRGERSGGEVASGVVAPESLGCCTLPPTTTVALTFW